MFLAASHLFYVNWGIGFLCLLIISSMINYVWGCSLITLPYVCRCWGMGWRGFVITPCVTVGIACGRTLVSFA